MVTPSKSIDGWTLIRRIDRGGQAEVYQAKKGEGETVCAIKIIKTASTKKRARFAQEVRKHLSTLVHKFGNV